MKQFIDEFQSSSEATIISICNFPIDEKKTGLMPSEYGIPPADFGDISLLTVDDAFFFVYIDEARGYLRSVTPAFRLAQSIVQDFINAQLCRAVDAEPGLFCVRGSFKKEEIKNRFHREIVDARARHKRWAEMLVAIGDDFWNSVQKRSSISQRSRDAANFLKIDRPWLNVAPAVIEPTVEMKDCPVCFERVNIKAIVCRSCKSVLDKEAYDKINKAA